MLGGGYHYMQLEGEFQADLANGNPSFYNTHTGPTSGTDFSFNKIFPIEFKIVSTLEATFEWVEVSMEYHDEILIVLKEFRNAKSPVQKTFTFTIPKKEFRNESPVQKHLTASPFGGAGKAAIDSAKTIELNTDMSVEILTQYSIINVSLL